MNPNQCSFCGRKKSEVEILISGQNGFICENCVEQAHAIVKESVGSASFAPAQSIDELKKPTETNGFILDGFPRTSFQTEALDQIVKEQLNSEISVCLSLVVDDEILVSRLVKRGETSGRVDDSEESIIRNRIKEYYAKTAEVAELYKQQGKYVEINGVGEISEISEKLFAEVEKIK